MALPHGLDALPRRGWVSAASPVTPLPALAEALGPVWLGAKRDDLIPALWGGTKVRKLDVLLAAPPWRDAPRWSSVGAIGSGHLVALSAAATLLDRRLDADVVYEPLTPEIRRNLGVLASGPVTLRYHGSRAALALARAPALLGRHPPGWIPPGATTLEGVLGVVLAGLELAGQVARGEVPVLDDIYVAAGTGGTAAGLAVGLGLAGLRPTVHAVSAVERPLLPIARIERWIRAISGWLGDAPPPAPVEVVRGFVGAGYGRETPAARAACERLADHGLALEPVYTGKAMAALLAAPLPCRRVLFWVTCHGRLPEPSADWSRRLPPRLERVVRTGPSRRGVLVGGAALAAGLLVTRRVTGYGRVGAWEGAVLARWEADVVAAVAEALVPDAPGGPLVVPAHDVARHVDRYLRGMPPRALAEVHALMALLEHGTLVDGHLARLTRLEPAARRSVLDRLASGPLRDAWRGIRDLCLLGTWQDDRSWARIGYDGPIVSHRGAPRRADGLPSVASPYDALVAAPGTVPRGTT